jgi:anthranilate phosphoribosyltransferase
MTGWLNGQIPEVLSGAILAALQAKGVSAAELAGMAEVLRQQSRLEDPKPHTTPVIDTCGTGGDGPQPLIFPLPWLLWRPPGA